MFGITKKIKSFFEEALEATNYRAKELEDRVRRLEFQLDNPPKFKTGDVIGCFTVRACTLEKDLPYNSHYGFRFKCIYLCETGNGVYVKVEESQLVKLYENGK